ncbi:MAG: DUF1614 domain-containing protein [Bacillota bacterium]
MERFPIGMIVLLIVAVLIYFGLAHRVLDRMRLTDKAALIIIGALIVGSFIDIPVPFANVDGSMNVGGFFVPIGVAIYVLSKSGTRKEVLRTVFAIAATAGAVYLVNSVLMGGDPWQVGRDFVDPLYVYPIVAGGIAYLVGRSRRGAFIAATIGVLVLDFINLGYLLTRGVRGTVAIGGGGVFDVIVLSGIFAVLLAEVVGETLERVQGGPKMEGRPRELLEGLSDIKSPEPAQKPLEDNAISKDNNKKKEINLANDEGGEKNDN